MKNKILILFLALSTVMYAKKYDLVIYCGITMVKPIKKIARIIEKQNNVKILITQGGSRDLYDELKASKVGDLYLPGSDSYIKRGIEDTIIEDTADIGFNQAAIFVQKGNPKNIKSLDSLLDEDLTVSLCDSKSGSIGRMSKKTLIKYKGEDFFYDVYDAAALIGTDSRNLNQSLKDKKIDATINWRASGTWLENKKYVDVVDIDEKYAPKKRLILSLLKFSKNKQLARKFIDFALSKEGKKIMKSYGFR